MVKRQSSKLYLRVRVLPPSETLCINAYWDLDRYFILYFANQ